MNKGENNLTNPELSKLAAMTSAAADYEENTLGLSPIKKPETLSEIIELKLFENKI